jgi:hypothetical protein
MFHGGFMNTNDAYVRVEGIIGIMRASQRWGSSGKPGKLELVTDLVVI